MTSVGHSSNRSRSVSLSPWPRALRADQIFLKQQAGILKSQEAGLAGRQTDTLHLPGITVEHQGDPVLVGAVVSRGQPLQNAECFGDLGFQRRNAFFRYQH